MKKRIVLTGCSRGLGLALTRGFEELGHDVFGCARSENSIAEMGNETRFFRCDVSNSGEVENFSKRVMTEGGAPDLLINNAAVINRNAPLWEVSDEEFSQVIDVNIKGLANTVRSFVPAMIKNGGGVIVNFSSYWGRSVSSEVAPYCATKYAVEGLTQALALELPGGFAAVALNPGVIHTEMLASCFGAGAAAHVSPEQWAEAAVPFIDGIDASFNGQSLTVPGQ